MAASSAELPEVTYHLQEVRGRAYFLSGGGRAELLLLHGFPASSFYYRKVDKFSYTFDHLGEVMEKFLAARAVTNCVIYMQDYGAPVGTESRVK